jgi:hypothetical protein
MFSYCGVTEFALNAEIEGAVKGLPHWGQTPVSFANLVFTVMKFPHSVHENLTIDDIRAVR